MLWKGEIVVESGIFNALRMQCLMAGLGIRGRIMYVLKTQLGSFEANERKMMIREEL